MTFQNFVCWRPEQVQRVMNVEATQPPDYVFLATHHPIAMKRGELIKGESEIRYSEQEFLRDFFATDDFAFVPVLGSAGTGKSHLIRWLAANIESTNRRKVLLIPKIGTNLKDIIGLILNIEGIEGEKFDEYRQRLKRATSTLTELQAREQLLNQLAIAVGSNGRHNRSQLTEVQDYLVEELDSLLYDPFFREHWLKDGSIIHRLVIHTLGRQNKVEIVEERRAFLIDDLPLDVLDLQKAGQKAQDFYGFLIGDKDIQHATVEWLNRHLDEAITQVLNLGREDLQTLMREVRHTLAEQDVELVLLIEDFAKLQGIDREVLEAVLARPQQPGSKTLCAIRTALACTTGYFESLIDTVQQRVTFSVNLDVGTVSNQSWVTEADIQQFAVRYLNAVRLKDEEIRYWAKSEKEDGINEIEPPSLCDECEYRQACHAGFGEVNGMGLYPFTPTALKQMLSRVNLGNFNPRILIKDVLKYTLENSVTDIQQGRFPSLSLREHFGKMRLSAIVQDEISSKDRLNAARREVLLDLWTDSNKLVDLPIEIHTAFNLPPLGVIVQQTQTSTVVLRTQETVPLYNIDQESPPEQTDEIPDKLAQQLKILDNWNNQGILPQDVEKDLREFIYPAILERIEWDTEMLLRGNFAGSNQIFKQRNVIFHSPKVTRGTYAGIVLLLPLIPDDEKDFRDTAIAFQGILQYSHYKHWTFPNGDRYFRAYAKQLERWSQYVLDEIRRRPREWGEPWNPVPAAVELLAIAARMSGHSTKSIDDLINVLFLELEDKDEVNRGKAWNDLFKVLQRNRKKLLEILESRIACTKGSRSQFQMIDAVQIIEPLKDVRKEWQPKCDIPNDLRQDYEVIQKVRQKIDELLVQAIEEERDRQLGVYQLLVAEFGEDIKKKDVIDAVKQAIDKAREAGVFGQKSAENLTVVIDQFQRTRFGNYIEMMKCVKAEIEKIDSNPTKLLQYLSETHQKAMKDAAEFIKETNNFLDTSITRAQNDIAQLKSDEGGTVESSRKGIESGLAQLRSLVSEMRR